MVRHLRISYHASLYNRHDTRLRGLSTNNIHQNSKRENKKRNHKNARAELNTTIANVFFCRVRLLIVQLPIVLPSRLMKEQLAMATSGWPK